MSNRERIEQMRAEADAAAKEKAAAKAAKAAQPAKSRRTSGKAEAVSPGRVRLVWNVCDPSGKEVQQFPYAQEQEARAEAQQRTAATGRTHFVTQGEVRVG
jgi:hypothetical protein